MAERVYIAGPMSGSGAIASNVRIAIQAADELMQAGFFPFVPHLTHFWHMISPKEYEEWLELDFGWLAVCNAVLRLPGESPGADREVDRATDLGIPVFYSVAEVVGWHRVVSGIAE